MKSVEVMVTCRCYNTVYIPDSVVAPDGVEDPNFGTFQAAVLKAINKAATDSFTVETIDSDDVYILTVDGEIAEIEI